MSPRKTRLDPLAMILMVTLCAAWGLNQVAAKVANQAFPPLLQAGLRSLGAAPLVLGWAVWRRTPLFARDGSLWAGLLAGVMFSAEFALVFRGLLYTPAARAVVFLYTAPFVVAIGLHLMDPAERLRPAQAAGLVCAFLGVVAVFGETLAVPNGLQWLGDTMLLGAAVIWGATTLVVRTTRLARVPAAKTLLYQLAVSAVLLPLTSLVSGEHGPNHPGMLDWVSLAFQTAGVAFASYLTWFWLITRYPATRLSAFSFLTPLFGMGFGALLLGEKVSPGLAVATALVAAGIWLVNRR